MAKEEKIRAGMHKGTAGSHGAYSAKHNDRNFKSSPEHIDKNLSENNLYWDHMNGFSHAMTFDEVERHFYESHFWSALDAINAHYIKNGHREKVRTMDDYRAGGKDGRSAPEETLWYLGDADSHYDADTLKKLVFQELAWEQQRFPQVRILDAAVHLDEPDAAPHVHTRAVWIGHDKSGKEIVCMATAQREMGIERPDPSRPQSKKNCPKQTYTRICREHFQELCMEAGLDIEVVPRDPREQGRPLEVYKAQKAKEKLQALERELAVKSRDNARLQAENERLQAERAAGEQIIAGQAQALEEQKAKLARYARYEVAVESVDIKATPVALSGGKYVKVEYAAYDKIIEMAKAYAVNKDKIDNLREIERIIRQRDIDSYQREQACSRREAMLIEREANADVQTLQARLAASESEKEALRGASERAEEKARKAQKRASDAEKKVEALEGVRRVLLNALAGIANALSRIGNRSASAVADFIHDLIHRHAPEVEKTIYIVAGEPVIPENDFEDYDFDDGFDR